MVISNNQTCLFPPDTSFRLLRAVLFVLFGMMIAGGLMIGWLPFGFTVAVYILEVIVAFIQAFIFTILATVYLGDAIKLH